MPPVPVALLGSFVALLTTGAPSASAARPAPQTAPGSNAEEAALPFEEVARRARQARETDAPDEAIRWYRQGVHLRPSWDEGWWYVGTLEYAADRYADAATAFEGFLALKPDAGPGWALRGLCEFQLGRYDDALRHLARGMALGSVGNAEIRQVVYYHFALLRIRASQFELAIEPLRSLVLTEPESPGMLDACGLLLLRWPLLPSEIPPDRAELVRAAGRAAFVAIASKQQETRERFEELLERYPDVPNLHYGYGIFIAQADAEEALKAHRREIEIQPEAVLPRLEIAFALLRRGDQSGARPYAEDAVRLAPGLFASHYVLGQVFLDLGHVERGVAEMEEAVRLAPESPEVRFALVRAYHAAGRTEDVERERAIFRKLEAQQTGPKNLLGFARDLTAAVEPPPTP